MKHNCKFKDEEDGEIYQPFQDAVLDGYIEYDDFYDGYLVSFQSFSRLKTKRILGIWLPGRYKNSMDILCYCPFCGDRIDGQTDGYAGGKRIR